MGGVWSLEMAPFTCNGRSRALDFFLRTVLWLSLLGAASLPPAAAAGNMIRCLNSTYHEMPSGMVMRNADMNPDPCAHCTAFPVDANTCKKTLSTSAAMPKSHLVGVGIASIFVWMALQFSTG